MMPRGPGPVVAVCAEYDRPWSRSPAHPRPVLAGARACPACPRCGFPEAEFWPPLRLREDAPPGADRRPARRAQVAPHPVPRGLDQAWHRRLGAILEIAWPCTARSTQPGRCSTPSGGSRCRRCAPLTGGFCCREFRGGPHAEVHLMLSWPRSWPAPMKKRRSCRPSTIGRRASTPRAGRRSRRSDRSTPTRAPTTTSGAGHRSGTSAAG